MAGLSLREAAQQAGTSKSTILRAIQSGRMSAAKTDDGGYAIDPSELFRVYPPKTDTDASNDAGQGDDRPMGQDAPPAPAFDTTELRIRNAELEAQISALKAILESEKERTERERQRCEDLKAERDRWAAQAERLALPAPTPASRRWWQFRRSA